MWLYELLYRVGQAPWERYSTVAADSIGVKLDREEADRRPGRALDLGCGRGSYAARLADRHYVVEHGRIVDMIETDQLEASMEKLQGDLGV